MKHRIITLAFLLAGLASSPADEVRPEVQTQKEGMLQEQSAAEMALTNAFKATASAIRSFDKAKSALLNNQPLLESSLRNIVLDLEPAYKTWHEHIGPKQEAAALRALEREADFKPYVDKVQKLWKGILKTRPLSLSFIAKVVGAEYPPPPQPETPETNTALIVQAVLLGSALLVALCVYLAVRKKKDDETGGTEDDETGGTDTKPETKPIASCEPDKFKDTYDIRDWVMSEDLRKDLNGHLRNPEQITPDKKYTMVVFLNGKEIKLFLNGKEHKQPVPLTKPFISFGRRESMASNGSGPDISFDIDENQKISLFHGILYYMDEKDSKGEECGFWMLALTQEGTPATVQEARLPQQSGARKILPGGDEHKGRIFPIRLKEKVFLSDSVSIIIE